MADFITAPQRTRRDFVPGFLVALGRGIRLVGGGFGVALIGPQKRASRARLGSTLSGASRLTRGSIFLIACYSDALPIDDTNRQDRIILWVIISRNGFERR